jgi:hypothetical protein
MTVAFFSLLIATSSAQGIVARHNDGRPCSSPHLQRGDIYARWSSLSFADRIKDESKADAGVQSKGKSGKAGSVMSKPSKSSAKFAVYGDPERCSFAKSITFDKKCGYTDFIKSNPLDANLSVFAIVFSQTLNPSP